MRHLSAHGVSAGHAGGKERERLAGGKGPARGMPPHTRRERRAGYPLSRGVAVQEKEEAHKADTIVESSKFWLRERVNAMMAMHTDKNAGLGATMFFGRSGERATFVQLCKDLCATKGALLFWSIMRYRRSPFWYKGAPPIWEWPVLAIIVYLFVIIFVPFHEPIIRFFKRLWQLWIM